MLLSQSSSSTAWIVFLMCYIPYIPECKPRIFGEFYKVKVGGSAYIRVYVPQKKITS